MRAIARLPVILTAVLALGASASAAAAASHKPALRGRHHDTDEGDGAKASRHGRRAAAETRASSKSRHASTREDDRPCSRWEIRHHRCEAVAAPATRTASRHRSGREALELRAAAPSRAAPVAAVAAGAALAAAPTRPKEVVLEDGQTLADVAARAGVSARDLATLNGVSLSEELPTGSTVRLPGAAAPRAATPSAPVLAQAAPAAQATAGTSGAFAGPRSYATLGPSSSGAVAPARTGRWSRTEADALAAYQVASARAPSLSGRADATHNRFVWPLKSAIASNYGAHGLGQRNEGLDFTVRPGDPVRAAAAGEVVYAGKEIAGVGNLVLLKHADGWVTAYSHLGRVTVAMRQTVDQGQEVAEAAKGEGDAAPPVHFEVRQPGAGGAKPVDPSTVLPARGDGATGQG